MCREVKCFWSLNHGRGVLGTAFENAGACKWGLKGWHDAGIGAEVMGGSEIESDCNGQEV